MTVSGASPTLRRAALLLGALLHLALLVGSPLVHAWLPADPHLPGWSEDRGDVPAAAHDESLCAFCQATGSPALPEPDASPAVPFAERATLVSAPASLHASPRRTRLRARAPPVSVA